MAILTLALGIGANTALFSVVNGVLLNPLPYLQPRRLVAIYGKTSGVDQGPISYLNFLDWQRDTKTFSCMAMYRNEDHIFTGTGEAERLSGYMISADFFQRWACSQFSGERFVPRTISRTQRQSLFLAEASGNLNSALLPMSLENRSSWMVSPTKSMRLSSGRTALLLRGTL